MKTTRDTHDLVGGLLMMAAGLFFAIYGREYNFGTAARMGPGYFPVVLGWMLTVLGALIALPAWWRRGTPVSMEWSCLFWCVLSLVAFALTLRTLGVVLASFIAALLALGPARMAWRTRLVICVVVALLTTLIFPIGLRMILPLWPWNI